VNRTRLRLVSALRASILKSLARRGPARSAYALKHQGIGGQATAFETPAKLLGVEFAASIARTTITDL
jgi:hypothetical protein